MCEAFKTQLCVVVVCTAYRNHSNNFESEISLKSLPLYVQRLHAEGGNDVRKSCPTSIYQIIFATTLFNVKFPFICHLLVHSASICQLLVAPLCPLYLLTSFTPRYKRVIYSLFNVVQPNTQLKVKMFIDNSNFDV